MVEPPELDFEAGQWISVPFGPQPGRAWSILSPPTRKRTIPLSVDVAPGGMGSQWLRALKPGDPVEFKGPTGGFVLNRADPRRAVFAARGIGLRLGRRGGPRHRRWGPARPQRGPARGLCLRRWRRGQRRPRRPRQEGNG